MTQTVANLEALCLGEEFIILPLRVNALAHQIHALFHPFCIFRTIIRIIHAIIRITHAPQSVALTRTRRIL